MLSDEGVSALRKWLGTDGIIHFSEMFNRHGTISTAIDMNSVNTGSKTINIPHPVHFREGMQVRNFLRTLPECANWTQDELDNRWSTAVIYAIHKIDKCSTSK